MAHPALGDDTSTRTMPLDALVNRGAKYATMDDVWASMPALQDAMDTWNAQHGSLQHLGLITTSAQCVMDAMDELKADMDSVCTTTRSCVTSVAAQYTHYTLLLSDVADTVVAVLAASGHPVRSVKTLLIDQSEQELPSPDLVLPMHVPQCVVQLLLYTQVPQTLHTTLTVWDGERVVCETPDAAM